MIYLHRYDRDTLARLRADYAIELQNRYEQQLASCANELETTRSNAVRVSLQKRLQTLRDQATELHDYEELLHDLADRRIELDLDDGVKSNHARLEKILAPIK